MRRAPSLSRLMIAAIIVSFALASPSAHALDASVGPYRLGDPASLQALLDAGARMRSIAGDCWIISALNATGDQQLNMAGSGAQPPQAMTEYRLARPMFGDSLQEAPVLSLSRFITELGLSLGMRKDEALAVLGLPVEQFDDDSGTEWYGYDVSALGLQLQVAGSAQPPSALYGFQRGLLVDITVGNACAAP